jgi:mono/diheme cytochrome c family protein
LESGIEKKRVKMFRKDNMKKRLQFISLPVIIPFLFVWVGVLGCQPKQVAEGKKTFNKYCSPCHGEGGAGDGYNAKNLDPHARDLTDAQEPYMAKLSNQEIYEVIDKGGRGVDLAPTMPTFGKVFSEEEIWNLVAYIRTLHPYKGAAVAFNEAKPYNAKRPRAVSVTEADFVTLMESKVADDAARLELVELGEQLFDEYGCSGCHRVRGKGGLLGPNLSRAGFMLQPQFIYRWVRNPQSFDPPTRMPNLDLPEEDALAVTLYLGTLKDPPFGGDGTGRDIAGAVSH